VIQTPPHTTIPARRWPRRRRGALLASAILVLLGSTVLYWSMHMEDEGTRTSLLDRKGILISALEIPATTASPEEAVDLLLTSSKDLRWITSKHLRPREQDRMRNLVQQLNQWLTQQQLL
jgi:hypothetical protein